MPHIPKQHRNRSLPPHHSSSSLLLEWRNGSFATAAAGTGHGPEHECDATSSRRRGGNSSSIHIESTIVRIVVRNRSWSGMVVTRYCSDRHNRPLVGLVRRDCGRVVVSTAAAVVATGTWSRAP